MKLYATVTSERASKGQGGNDFLDIQLFVGNSKNSLPFASYRLSIGASPDTDEPAFIFTNNETGEVEKWIEIKEVTKGERQKGERAHDYHGLSRPCWCGK